MKTTGLLLMILFATSCSVVHFNQPQPKDGVRLYTIPEELQGSWKTENGETIAFYEDCFMTEDFKTDSMGNILDTTREYTYLSDSMKLYRGGDYYVFNDFYQDGSCRIMVAKNDKEGGIRYYFCDDPTVYGKMRGLRIDSALVLASDYHGEIDELVTYDTLLINPKLKDLYSDGFDQIRYVYFRGQMRVKDLEKVCREEYLTEILRKDGSIYIPTREKETGE